MKHPVIIKIVCMLCILLLLMPCTVLSVSADLPALRASLDIDREEGLITLYLYASGGAVSAVSGEIRYDNASFTYISCTSGYMDWKAACSDQGSGRLSFLTVKNGPASSYNAETAVIAITFAVNGIPDDSTLFEIVKCEASDGVGNFKLADRSITFGEAEVVTLPVITPHPGTGDVTESDATHGVQESGGSGLAWIWAGGIFLLFVAFFLFIMGIRMRKRA